MYSIILFLIFIRLILSWFGRTVKGKSVDVLMRITAPYLDFCHRNFNDFLCPISPANAALPYCVPSIFTGGNVDGCFVFRVGFD